MKKLTDEDLKSHKLHKQFWRQTVRITVLYLSALFLGNLAIAMIDLAYMHSEEFRNAASFGSTIIILIGLRFEQEKAYSKMKSEIEKISKEAKR